MAHDVQRATASDFLAIAALDRVAWESNAFIPDGEHVWRVWCEYATVLVVRWRDERPQQAGDIAAALVMFCTRGGELFLHKIMVHPGGRGQGMGSVLLEAALTEATAPVLLTVDPNNGRAVELYRRYGFTVREHVQGYYRAHEDRYLMVYTPRMGRAPVPADGGGDAH